LNVVWLILAVLIWGIVHSVLASLESKAWFRSTLGDGVMRYYRFGYNVFSVVSFAPILLLIAVLPDRVLYHIPAPWLYLFLVGQVGATIMLVVGVLQTDTLSFIGLRQLFERSERSSKLITSGLYRWIRHPLYTAGLVFIWLTPIMSQNSLIVFFALTIYILIGAYFEERKLEREFGSAYAEYKAATPMLIPGLVFGRNK